MVSESIAIIREYLVSGDDPLDGEELDASKGLLDEGVLDSFRLMTLIQFISERFDIELQPDDVVPENFRTLEAIASLVDGKIAEANGGQ